MPRPSSARRRSEITRQKQAAAAESRARRDRRRKQILAGAVVVVVVLSTVGAFLGARSSSSSSPTTAVPTTTTTMAIPADGVTPEPAAPGATITGPTPCPAEDGSSPRTTSFAEAPPMCIDTGYFHTATITTTSGTMTVQLNPSQSPSSVNDFIVLARYHFYDGQPITSVAARAGFTIGTSFEGGGDTPGFAIAPEQPAGGIVFTPGSLAIRPTSASGAGAQLVVSTFEAAPANDQDVNPLGIMLSGDELLTAVDALASQSGEPTAPVVIITITISRSSPIPR